VGDHEGGLGRGLYLCRGRCGVLGSVCVRHLDCHCVQVIASESVGASGDLQAVSLVLNLLHVLLYLLSPSSCLDFCFDLSSSDHSPPYRGLLGLCRAPYHGLDLCLCLYLAPGHSHDASRVIGLSIDFSAASCHELAYRGNGSVEICDHLVDWIFVRHLDLSLDCRVMAALPLDFLRVSLGGSQMHPRRHPTLRRL
jgi:hypothetical protein